MSETIKEITWYTNEIEQHRVACDRLWADYADRRRMLDRMERERAVLFQKLMQDAEARLKRAG